MAIGRIMHGALCAAGVALLWSACGSSLARENLARVDTKRILAEAASGKEWLTCGGTYDEQRFSPLRGITPANVTGAWSVVAALDARSGKLLWEYDPKVPREQLARGCCDAVNRGVAAERRTKPMAGY